MLKNHTFLTHSFALMQLISVALMLLKVPLVGSSFLSMFSHVHEEKRTLDQIYAAALKEGGRLIVYAGGDTAGQQDYTKAAFEQQFPNMTLDIVVDYSKFQGPRIEYQVIDKYGWKWVEAFVKQQPIMVRGTQAPPDMVNNGTAVASMTTAGSLNPSSDQKSRLVLPAKDGFTMWAQQAAIFKNAKHPEAAKLYLNWQLTKEMQKAYMWSVRTDVPAPNGFLQSWEYKNQSSHKAFAAFMEDREEVERLRNEIAFFFGEPKGDPSPGFPGLYPDKALPH